MLKTESESVSQEEAAYDSSDFSDLEKDLEEPQE